MKNTKKISLLLVVALLFSTLISSSAFAQSQVTSVNIKNDNIYDVICYSVAADDIIKVENSTLSPGSLKIYGQNDTGAAFYIGTIAVGESLNYTSKTAEADFQVLVQRAEPIRGTYKVITELLNTDESVESTKNLSDGVITPVITYDLETGDTVRIFNEIVSPGPVNIYVSGALGTNYYLGTIWPGTALYYTSVFTETTTFSVANVGNTSGAFSGTSMVIPWNH